MKTLSEVFMECTEKFKNDRLKAERSLITAAKKNDPNVTMVEIRKFLGYWDQDKKKDAVKSNKFSAEVFHPVRKYATIQLLGLSASEAEALWKNAQKGEDLPEEVIKQRNKVKEKLPRVTRESKSKAEQDLSDVVDLDF